MNNNTEKLEPHIGQVFIMSSTKDNPFDRIEVKIADRKQGYIQYSIRLSDGTFGNAKNSMREAEFLKHYELSAIEQ